MPTPIRHVSDTALWVAMYRAFETERPDAIFRDPHARRMAGARGAAIVAAMPGGARFAWPMIVRTAVMDEIILRCVGAGAGTVINLAAGLDTRAFRMDLPPALHWYDVDLPDMTAYRRAQLEGATPVCVHEHVSADLTDAAARAATIERLASGPGPALVVAEGLLVYLTRADVSALAGDLHAQPGLRWWLIDHASPELLKMLARNWGPHLRDGNAPMRFAPAEGTAFYAPFGWREAEFRSTFEEAVRLRRMPRGAWVYRLLGRLMSPARRLRARRFAGVVLFERS